MKITPIAILVIFIILFIIVKNYKADIKKFYIEIFELYFLVSIIMNIGYFLKIDNFDVGIDTFLSLVVFILSLPMIFFGYYDKKLLKTGCILYACVIFSVVGGLILPYSGEWIHSLDLWDSYINGSVNMSGTIAFSSQTVIYLIAVIRFPVIFSVVYYFYKQGSLKNIFGLVNKAVVITILYGVIEVVLKKIIGVDTTPYINQFFGEAEATASGVDRLQGLCKEPSQYATILFGLSEFQILEIRLNSGYSAKKKRVNNLKLIILLLFMLLSGSFIALLFAVLVVITYFFLVVPSSKKIRWVVAGVIFLIAALIVIPRIESVAVRVERLWLVIKSLSDGRFGSGSTSEAARFISIIEMFKLSLQRPLFGIGLGQTDAHSTLAAILGNCGYLGLISYLLILYRCGNGHAKQYNIFYLLLLIPMLISGGLGYLSQITTPMLLMLFDGKVFVDRGEKIENYCN